MKKLVGLLLLVCVMSVPAWAAIDVNENSAIKAEISYCFVLSPNFSGTDEGGLSFHSQGLWDIPHSETLQCGVEVSYLPLYKDKALDASESGISLLGLIDYTCHETKCPITKKIITPYLQAGVGPTLVSAKIGKDAETKTFFSLMVGPGVNTKITDDIEADIGLKYYMITTDKITSLLHFFVGIAF